MKVVLAGGSGFIGRHLTEELISRGHRVVILSRDPARHRSKLPAGAEMAAWQPHEGRIESGILDAADAVINLAGESIGAGRFTRARKHRILESRLAATRTIVRELKKSAAEKKILLNASAVGYYGTRGDEPVTETDAPGSDFLAQVCTVWEKAAQEAEPHVQRLCILRIGVVLGRDGGALPKMALPFRLFLGGRLGHGRQWMPWIHIRDLVNAVVFLLEQKTASGPFNLVAPEPVTNAEWTQTLARVLHRPAWFPVPAFVLKLALGEAAILALEGQRALPTRLQQLQFRFQFPRLQPALEDLFRRS